MIDGRVLNSTYIHAAPPENHEQGHFRRDCDAYLLAAENKLGSSADFAVSENVRRALSSPRGKYINVYINSLLVFVML